MSSRFLHFEIDLSEKGETISGSLRKREAPLNYQVSENEIKWIIHRCFEGKYDTEKFTFTTKELSQKTDYKEYCAEAKLKYENSSIRIQVDADFEEWLKKQETHQLQAS